MDCGCNCMGIAASSKVPVKRYNVIIQDLFDNKPDVQPQLVGKLDAQVEKKVKLLCEYVDFMPHRAPKVSRRLARRLQHALGKEQYGDVKLAVYCYAYLLERLSPETALIFAREVILEPVDYLRKKMHRGSLQPAAPEVLQLKSVVGTLLSHRFPELRVLGSLLLISFTKVPGSGSYVQQLEGFVPMLCANAAVPSGGLVECSPSRTPARRLRSKLSTTARDDTTAANAALAVRGNSAGGAGGATQAGDGGLRPPAAVFAKLLCSSSLRALQVYVQLQQSICFPSEHMQEVVAVVMDAARQTPGPGQQPQRSATMLLGQRLVATMSKLKVTSDGERGSMLSSFNLQPTAGDGAGASSSVSDVALEVLYTLAATSKDPSLGKRTLGMVWDYLTRHQLWQDQGVRSPILRVASEACRAEGQSFLLFTSLVRAAAYGGGGGGLTPASRAAAVREASALAAGMEPGFPTPALVLTLRELSPYLPSEEQSEGILEQAQLRSALLGLLRQLAGMTQGVQQVAEVLAGLMSTLQPQGSGQWTRLLDACAQVAGASREAKPQGAQVLAGRSLPDSLLDPCVRVMSSPGSTPAQRRLVHRMLAELAECAPQGLTPGQAKVLLSAMWHEALRPDSGPELLQSLDGLFHSAICSPPATSDATLAEVAHAVHSLQEVALDPQAEEKEEVVAAAAGVDAAAAVAAGQSKQTGGSVAAVVVAVGPSSAVQRCRTLALANCWLQQLGKRRPGVARAAVGSAPCAGIKMTDEGRLHASPERGEAVTAEQQEQAAAKALALVAAASPEPPHHRRRLLPGLGAAPANAAALPSSSHQGGGAGGAGSSRRGAADLGAAPAAAALFGTPEGPWRPLPVEALQRGAVGVGGARHRGLPPAGAGPAAESARLRTKQQQQRGSAPAPSDPTRSEGGAVADTAGVDAFLHAARQQQHKAAAESAARSSRSPGVASSPARQFSAVVGQCEERGEALRGALEGLDYEEGDAWQVQEASSTAAAGAVLASKQAAAKASPGKQQQRPPVLSTADDVGLMRFLLGGAPS